MNPNVELVKALRQRVGQSDLHLPAADAIEVLDKQIADILDPKLTSMRLEDGKFDMALGGPIVQNVALMMTEWFRESGAKNYVEMTLHARTAPFERYQFYVQKQGDGAKTPHELRKEVEAERDALKELVAKIDYALRKDSLADSERVASARHLLSHLRTEPAQALEADHGQS